MKCQATSSWNQAQAGIKIAGRNINNLSYADDTTLIVESKEELKSLLMKVKAVLSHSVVFNSLWPHGLQPARLLCPWEFSRQEYWSQLPCPPPGDLPNPGIKLRSPALQADSLLTEPPGKSKNTGVGSLCLLQVILPTQESSHDLLHCRRILYQLSYQEAPYWTSVSSHRKRSS